jgi:steroid 5-alpha reductase family enzyme
MNDQIYMLLGPIVLIHFFYAIAVIKKNLSVIDTAWGLGFILIVLAGCILNGWQNIRENIQLILVSLWGARLALFIHSRNTGKGEDFRYANWRKEWGDKTNLIAYFKVYWLQFFLMLIAGLPLFAGHSSNGGLIWINYLGIGIWLVGLLWESIADYQKGQFKAIAANQHKIYQGGLWKFSRHPNYFGEFFLWWGIALVALDGYNNWALIGPAFLTLLLWKVSGVPLVEQRHEKNPDFQAYKDSTPVLIPSLKKMFKR